ncbi:MAG: WD40 repeat domain-containing protein [Clostridia bacterium]
MTVGGHNLTFSPDGKILAASEPDLSGEFYLFDMEDFSKISTKAPDGRISKLQFSPDGSILAYGLHGGGVEVLNTEDWSVMYSFEQDDTVTGLSFTPDSKTMVVGSKLGTLYVYKDR